MAPINNYSKNSLIQKYLDKTVWDNWSSEGILNNQKEKKRKDKNDDDFIGGIGYPSLDFLQEIQKSISYKLGKKYKYYSNIDLNNKKDRDGDSDDDNEGSDEYSDSHNEENINYQENEGDTNSNTGDDDTINDNKDNDSNNNDSNNDDSNNSKNNKENENNNDDDKETKNDSKKRKRNKKENDKNTKEIRKEFNRFPLSEPSIKPIYYNGLCGPDVLVSLVIKNYRYSQFSPLFYTE
ncbi:hypothetical protein DICPUDRAFT_156283 [Dictyostelium purpureum]|uniref:Uncharacterized protein n=1 Tax=Dictyostelium purpureum TaxID=5786 RepID=F0ZW69_DICPU|nr:uncharacterized protein DICPUDRAFT_156283 [Dictyostelium purpureum]EGC31818.1 hypothetical protein DICPUDRAFT_156283 [Dictyostelium purpureum]|eukprot:XP_003291652.1 hypothetical protein DICPUDRAFT_156283 [Dictyostelium purpureum]